MGMVRVKEIKHYSAQRRCLMKCAWLLKIPIGRTKPTQ